jgi:hypothetical protein
MGIVPGFAIHDELRIVTEFSWGAVEFSDIPIFYRLVILETLSQQRVFGTARVQNMLSSMVPEGILKPGKSYRWRVWTMDNSDGFEVQNRSNSKWHTFRMAETLE